MSAGRKRGSDVSRIFLRVAGLCWSQLGSHCHSVSWHFIFTPFFSLLLSPGEQETKDVANDTSNVLDEFQVLGLRAPAYCFQLSRWDGWLTFCRTFCEPQAVF